ncbi:DNA cytosine methyltransferase [Polaromonas sp. CF318]|uniref:DNA cytosine methyltransferase n=1 Tax=Polaromonas sp. CF318 TaxID=1144318 RepID=UPI000565C66B|nr:DNA cytosine methyltransferase [Polaromonas sp. CF318]
MSLENIHHFHVCGGVGSGAAGFNDADPTLGTLKGKMVCVGGVDVDPRACADFKQLTGVAQTCRDMFSLGQYSAFHGHMPPPGWVEMVPQDMRDAAHRIFPDIVFTSMPCKGFSGLLSAVKSTTIRYQALNELTLRGVWLALEAFADNLPSLFIFENVPRIATRGRHLLDQIVALLRHYGYIVNETYHDCGELGDGMSQSRRRFLLVARLPSKIPSFLYEPPKRALRPVSDVLGYMPMPGDELGGPMHRIPSLQWKTWVRLAFVEAGSDWRSLNKLAVEDGRLKDYLIMPLVHSGMLGVNEWGQPMGTITSRGMPNNGNFSVADPRQQLYSAGYGVTPWGEPSGAVSGESLPSNGRFSVADPRLTIKHNNCFRIVKFDQHAGTVTGGTGPSAGAQGVADPRPAWDGRHGHLHVTDYEAHSRTVTAGGKGVQVGYLSVADPRPGMQREKGDHYLTGGHYGVVPWSASSGAVSASACHDNGPWSVADPRPMPAPSDKIVCRIQALDGTWHRPFTTLELAALQTIIDPEEWFAPGGPGSLGQTFVMDGSSDQRWREGIGNAVPRKSAKAIGTVMGQTILLARSGETFALGSTPIWVQPLAVALSVQPLADLS